MSVKATNWAWHDSRTAHLKGNAMMALLALADIADEDGHVIYVRGEKRAQKSLASKARMSVASFRRVTGQLADEGLLEVSRESRTTENEYRLILTAQIERSDDDREVTQMSARNVADERSHRSRVSARTSLIQKNVSTDVSEVSGEPLRSDVEELLDLLDEEIIRNGGKAPARSKKNIDAARLLLDRDGKTVEQVKAAIRWCQADEFWRSNILSMSKLREQYERLRMQAQRGSRASALDVGREADRILAEREALALGVSS